MARVCIITDSNSGITQEQAKELDIVVIPMPFYINGKEYKDGIDLSQEQFYKMLEDGYDVATSQPSIGDLSDLWTKQLESYDEIIYIPMSSGLSSSMQTATALAEDEFAGKVFVVDNQRISVTQRRSALEAKKMADKGIGAKEIKDFLLDTKFDSTIYITIDTMKYLKKGGRVTPAAATFAEILNIKPVLTIQGEKLDSYSKARGMNAAKKAMIKAIQADIDNRFGGLDTKNPRVYIDVAHTQNYDAALAWVEELKTIFPNHEFYIDPLSLSVSCHIGPGALAITATLIHDI